MHGPVVAAKLGELPGAVERVDDPHPIGGQPHGVVGAFLGEHRVGGPLLASAAIRKSWDRLSPAAFRSAPRRVGEFGAHVEQQLPACGRQPRGHLVVGHRSAFQQFDHLSAKLVGGAVRRQPQIRVLRPLIRAVDPGEVRDLARARLGVQALRVAALAVLQRGVAEHLEEVEARRRWCTWRASARCSSSGLMAGTSTTWPESASSVGDVGEPAQVLGAIGHREAEIGVESVAQVVPVENIGGTALFEQLLLDEHGHRRLARPGQPGEPHGPALRQPVLGGAQRLVAHGVRDSTCAR